MIRIPCTAAVKVEQPMDPGEVNDLRTFVLVDVIANTNPIAAGE